MTAWETLDEALGDGRLDDALRLADEAVSALRAGPPTSVLAMALADQARVKARAGQLPAAVACAEEGLRIAAQAGPGVEPELRIVLADIYERLGELARADEQCVRALLQLLGGRDAVRVGARVVSPGLARRKITAARIAERRGHLLRAAHLLRGVLLDAASVVRAENADGDMNAVAYVAFMSGIEHLVRLHRGRVARKLDDHALAREELAAALARSAEVGDAEAAMYAQLEMALLDDAAGDPLAALGHVLDALQWYESGLANIRDDELRVAARSSQEDLFARAVQTAIEGGAGPMAWRLAEHARGRVFYARMAAAQAAAGQDALRPTQGEPVTAAPATVVPATVVPAAAVPPPEAGGAAGDAAERGAARTAAARRDDALAALNAKERAIFRPVPRLLPAVPEWLARPGGSLWSPGQATGILEFFVTDDVMCSFFITGAGAAIRRHRMPPGALAHGVTRLRALLEDPDAGARELARRSGQLYRWLVEPYEDQMRGLKRLVVIPYGILNYVPFCVLGDGQMLIDQFEVCRAPSAAILDQLLAAPAPAVGPAIVFADPHPEDDRLGLPYAAEEARRIVTALPAQTVSGPAATTGRFLAALDRYDVLHLACHALFDPHEPQRSSLVFADQDDPRRPAYLSVSRLYNRRATARLAVLSGCQTGLADLAPGGELDGLVRAFLMAGVRTVIASQWRVDDEATADLMAAMYRNLSAGQQAGAALRAAQLAVRGNPGFAHPHFWAAFELSGDWRLRTAAAPPARRAGPRRS